MTVAADSDQLFAGSIPEIYDTHLVPLIFEPYAVDLAARLASKPLANLLELAAGTGVVTRHLAATLNPDVAIVATDLNQPMLDRACAVGTARSVEWRQADALQLPFGDAVFDAVVCQFGAMFFPDKAHAFAEARRVLRPGGVLIFNVWDRIEENEFAATVCDALAGMFPDNPPRFMARVPHGYHDRPTIERDLAQAGFANNPEIQVVTARSRAATPRIPAMAYCQGTPLRSEIEARSVDRLREATDVASAAIATRFGQHVVDGRIQALVITVNS
ncbi:MAG: class I SAM-dependent methyltransferase [Pseudomonadota bacterium]